MIQQFEIGPGVLIVFYEDKGEKWVEIASNYNLSAPMAADVQRHVGNVFLPLRRFLEILNHQPMHRSATEW